MICTHSISGVDVERVAYIFGQLSNPNVNMLIGKFYEQENDCGERQYVYEVYQNRISHEIRRQLQLPGIDLTTKQDIYIRSYEIPYFVECSVPPRNRPDVKFWLDRVGLDYYDEFEFMLRTRAISQHTNCYLGRTSDDYFDVLRAKSDPDFWRANVPNLDEKPENVFHKAMSELVGVDYDR